MTTISAKIIADSVSEEGLRLTTMALRYPRYIHAEVMTHRVLSRNARSSRAVPVPKMIEEVIDDPVVPIHWGAAQKGMQAYEECHNDVFVPWPEEHGYFLGDAVSERTHQACDREEAWLRARDEAARVASAFHRAGYAKQVINRLLEPFLHIDTLVSATEWTNFFALRDHHAAEPHIQRLAQVMKAAMAMSVPRPMAHGVWHLPYIDSGDTWMVHGYLKNVMGVHVTEQLIEETLVKVSAARCARISYEPFDGDGSIESEMRRYNLLVGSAPVHASPCEHQATPDHYIDDRALVPQWANPDKHRNLRGWQQARAFIPGENVTAAA